MESRRSALWCKVLGKDVMTILQPAGRGREQWPGVPAGWTVKECLDKDVECFGKGCPFTMDGGESPFGRPEEPPDHVEEPFDPLAEPGFEGEWD
jgi:hypothetical protein